MTQHGIRYDALVPSVSAYLNPDDNVNLINAVLSQTNAFSTVKLETQTAFLTSEICEQHHIPAHPESPHRLRVIRERLLRDFPQLKVIVDIPRVTTGQLILFHTQSHVDMMFQHFSKLREKDNKKKDAMLHIDDDTAIMGGTEEAALFAAGAVCHAIDLVMDPSTGITNAFCGVRPPGHHAEPNQAMGFCLFNNVGIGACHVLHTYPEQIHRVLILDFDVHHGNGSQAKFNHNWPQVLFISSHQGEFYPGTGHVHERGSHNNILNLPLKAKTTSKTYRQLFETKVVPAMDAFAPDFILISAGFDAHRMDPLAEIALESEDYYWITQHATRIANKYAQGRIVSTLEGGYNLEALAESASAHVRALVENIKQTQGDSVEVENLTLAINSVSLTENSELRVTVHYKNKDKVLILQDRLSATLLKMCKNKFNLKKKMENITIYNSHGIRLNDHMLASLANDEHVYLR